MVNKLIKIAVHMRNIIIGASILLFALSGIAIVKALSIPDYRSAYMKKSEPSRSKDISAESDNKSEQLAKEQAANEARVKDLQATITKLESKLSDKNEEAQAKAEPEISQDKARVLTVLGAGAFRSGQVVISEDLIDVIKAIVPEILESPGQRIVIEGHTDNIPINLSSRKQYKDNMELSFFRAKAVEQVLVENGIPQDRISVIGYGDTRPLESNETYEGRVKNRRVEIKLVPANKEF